MDWIDKLEAYYDDIPKHLQPDVRAFLDDYYEKRATHSAFSVLLKHLNKPLLQGDYNYFTLTMPKILQTPMLQYIEFFKDYVEATKGKNIIFDVKRDKAGLILITNGNTGITLPELGAYFHEYLTLIKEDLEKWIPHFETPKTALEADILRLKVSRQVTNLRQDLDLARLENKHLAQQLSDAAGRINFLEDLSHSLNRNIERLLRGKTADTMDVDQLLLDIIDVATRMLERKYSHQLENLHNDTMTHFLRQKGYIADYSRSGRSATGLGVGELDILIRKKNGTPFSIIEAFRLNSCGENNPTVAQHIDKLLHDYDTAGHQRNFVIVYAEAKNFERLWGNYKDYVSELNGKPQFQFQKTPLVSFKEKKGISEKANIKIGRAKHRREGAFIEVHHVFMNMFG